MRSYPRNSPQAAGRIVALALLADGHLSRTETAALERQQVHQRLGIGREALDEVLRHLAEDLVATGASAWSGAGVIDESVVRSLLDEIDDPALRRTVLGLCLAVTFSDSHFADGEQAVLAAAGRHWGVPVLETA